MHLSGILLNCKGLNKIHSYHICSPSTLCTPPGTNFGITALFQYNVQLQHINYLFLKKSLAEVLCSSPLCCTKKVNWSKTHDKDDTLHRVCTNFFPECVFLGSFLCSNTCKRVKKYYSTTIYYKALSSTLFFNSFSESLQSEKQSIFYLF